jgi:hypothetical protein
MLVCVGAWREFFTRLRGLSPSSRHDSQEALRLVDAIPSLQGEREQPRRRPGLCVRGSVTTRRRSAAGSGHITSFLDWPRRTMHGSGLGRWRWVVERTITWLNRLMNIALFRKGGAYYNERVPLIGLRIWLWLSALNSAHTRSFRP